MNRRLESKRMNYGRLMEAAETLFRERGYDGVGVRDIAAAAGRSTGSIFLFWESKDDIWRDTMSPNPPDAVAFARRVTEASSLEAVQADAAEFLRFKLGERG